MNRRELAQAMRAGIQRPGVIEDHKTYLKITRDGCFVCALGSAIIELYDGDYETAQEEFRERYVRNEMREDFEPRRGTIVLAEMLGVDPQIALEVSSAHEWEKKSITEIASWLEEPITQFVS